MKIVIFTFKDAPKERQKNVKSLKTKISKAIQDSGIDLEVCSFVGSNKTCENLISLCSLYKDEDILMLEDDIELSEHFLETIRKIIEQYPDRIINFHYNFDTRGPELYSDNSLKIFEERGSSYAFNQCVYLPSKVLQEILDFKQLFKVYYAYAKENRHAYIMARIFEENNEKFLVVKPSLVKHKEFKSTISESVIETKDFID